VGQVLIGLILSGLALGSALLVARRRPSHRALAWPLGAAFWYALEVGGEPITLERGALLSMSLIPLGSALAYLHVWGGPRWDAAMVFLGWLALALWIRFAPYPDTWWTAATYGPSGVAVAVGLGALVAFEVRRSQRRAQWEQTGDLPRFPRRPLAMAIAASLLVGDAGGLALTVYRGGGIEWMSRVQLAVVTLLQVGWLVSDSRRAPASSSAP
jgi:hypothetical protein